VLGINEALDMIVNFSGMIASGKTTLKSGVSAETGWASVEESKLGAEYLCELFEDPERWAYEVQATFLAEKFLTTIHALKKSDFVLMDRSFEEDAEIFFEYFYSRYINKPRTKASYSFLYEGVRESLQVPSVAIICTASLPTILHRISQRPKKFNNYPEGHITEIYELYDDYISKKRTDDNVYFVDSDENNFRCKEVVLRIANDIRAVISSECNVPALSILTRGEL
jgi:deoxyadenosine/deoxycytidine kinase